MSDLIYPDPNAPRLASVEIVGDYAVRVVFSDGAIREADLSKSYVFPSGKKISSPAEFARVELDEQSDTLVWPDEFFHVHSEELYESFFPRPVGASS